MAGPKIFHLLHMSHRAVFRAADRVLAARFGVTAGQHALLLYLSRREGAAQAVAAQALGLKNASMSGLVDRMEAKGLVRREESETDKRAYALHLTPEGAAIVAESGPLIRKTNEHLLAGYSEAEQQKIGFFLEDLILRAEAFDVSVLDENQDAGPTPAETQSEGTYD